MRTIKFRVRKKDTNEIIGYERVNKDGQWEHQYLNREYWSLGAITFGQEYLEAIREQFTGILDRNKDEIYEGQEVNCYNWGVEPNNLLMKSIVYWDNDDKGWSLQPNRRR